MASMGSLPFSSLVPLTHTNSRIPWWQNRPGQADRQPDGSPSKQCGLLLKFQILKTIITPALALITEGVRAYDTEYGLEEHLSHYLYHLRLLCLVDSTEDKHTHRHTQMHIHTNVRCYLFERENEFAVGFALFLTVATCLGAGGCAADGRSMGRDGDGG